MRGWRWCGLVVAILTGGCGPLSGPMFQRLPDESQAQVNGWWNAMTTPAGRVDREVLLDVIVMNQLWQLGVDRGEFRAEKSTAGGTVVMDIRYDLHAPATDRFELRVYDLGWKLLRSETYTRQDIDRAMENLREMDRYLNEPSTQPATDPCAGASTQAATAPATGPAATVRAGSLAESPEWRRKHEEALKMKEKLDAAMLPGR